MTGSIRTEKYKGHVSPRLGRGEKEKCDLVCGVSVILTLSRVGSTLTNLGDTPEL